MSPNATKKRKVQEPSRHDKLTLEAGVDCDSSSCHSEDRNELDQTMHSRHRLGFDLDFVHHDRRRDEDESKD